MLIGCSLGSLPTKEHCAAVPPLLSQVQYWHQGMETQEQEMGTVLQSVSLNSSSSLRDRGARDGSATEPTHTVCPPHPQADKDRLGSLHIPRCFGSLVWMPLLTTGRSAASATPLEILNPLRSPDFSSSSRIIWDLTKQSFPSHYFQGRFPDPLLLPTTNVASHCVSSVPSLGAL